MEVLTSERKNFQCSQYQSGSDDHSAGRLHSLQVFVDGKTILHRVEQENTGELPAVDPGLNRTRPCANEQFVVGQGAMAGAFNVDRNALGRHVDPDGAVPSAYGDAVELRAVGKTMPVQGLSAEKERQTADAVVGKVVLQQHSDLRIRIHFPGA